MSEEEKFIEVEKSVEINKEECDEDSDGPPELEGPLMDQLAQDLEGVDLDNPEEAGKKMGGMIANLMKSMQTILKPQNSDTTEDGEAQEEPSSDDIAESMLTKFFGADMAAKAMRMMEVEKFFKLALLEGNMSQAIIKTKAEFDLPDDYAIQTKLTISFDLSNLKTEKPCNLELEED